MIDNIVSPTHAQYLNKREEIERIGTRSWDKINFIHHSMLLI